MAKNNVPSKRNLHFYRSLFSFGLKDALLTNHYTLKGNKNAFMYKCEGF